MLGVLFVLLGVLMSNQPSGPCSISYGCGSSLDLPPFVVGLILLVASSEGVAFAIASSGARTQHATTKRLKVLKLLRAVGFMCLVLGLGLIFAALNVSFANNAYYLDDPVFQAEARLAISGLVLAPIGAGILAYAKGVKGTEEPEELH